MIALVRSAAGALACGVALSLQAVAFAEHPIQFPWGPATRAAHSGSGNSAGASAPYQILTAAPAKHQPAVTLQAMPPKVGYAYGWFGSNPTPQGH